jgi:hypothetical protein
MAPPWVASTLPPVDPSPLGPSLAPTLLRRQQHREVRTPFESPLALALGRATSVPGSDIAGDRLGKLGPQLRRACTGTTSATLLPVLEPPSSLLLQQRVVCGRLRLTPRFGPGAEARAMLTSQRRQLGQRIRICSCSTGGSYLSSSPTSCRSLPMLLHLRPNSWGTRTGACQSVRAALRRPPRRCPPLPPAAMPMRTLSRTRTHRAWVRCRE